MRGSLSSVDAYGAGESGELEAAALCVSEKSLLQSRLLEGLAMLWLVMLVCGVCFGRRQVWCKTCTAVLLYEGEGNRPREGKESLLDTQCRARSDQ